MSRATPIPDDLPATGAWRPGDPAGDRRFHTLPTDRPLQLESGAHLDRVDVAYETWGTLAPSGDNAVLVCHALTGDSHAAGRDGWWEGLIGPGRAIDTDRWFVVCSNVLGGCQGTTGPASVDPATGRPLGSSFPVVTIRDMVRVQASLADGLGITRWRAVVGGSMGGMQALEWAITYPDRVGSLVLASTTAEASAQQIAWSHIGRSAILADPGFRGGDYYDAAPGEGPWRGLMVARMCAQVTYRSDEVFADRFHRSVIDRFEFSDAPVFDIENYLDYHGVKLVRRFDANSYLRLNRAMDLHDVARGRGSRRRALERVSGPVLVSSVRSDGLYPPVQQLALADEFESIGLPVEHIEIDSPHGHDAFLIETQLLGPAVRRFLEDRLPPEEDHD